MRSYLFFGPPGSGKGTQKDLLKEVLEEKNSSTIIIETGQLLRDLANEGDTITKKQLAKVMNRGDLVPSAFPISTWVNRVIHEKGDYEHIIVDGAGRKLIEAKVIVELLQFFPDLETHIIYLEIPDEEVITRLLKRGRTDDKEEVIKNRIEKYKDNETGTTASINFLRKNKDVVFHEVDGIGTIQEVQERIHAKLDL